MEARPLYIFNPDHDLALAHGTNHYVPPASAVEFARDCAALPAWFARDNVVYLPNLHLPSAFLCDLQRFVNTTQFVDAQEIKEIGCCPKPWGWNHNLAQWLLKQNAPPHILPCPETLARIRDLSHRRTAIHALQYLQQNVADPQLLPSPATELTTPADVEAYVHACGDVMLKMPWSGSGRGLRHVVGALTPHQRGWANQSSRKSGCVVGERYLLNVQDFAMEFYCRDGLVDYCGISIFTTHNGIYQENLMMPENGKVEWLSRNVDVSLLDEYRIGIEDFIRNNVAPCYSGPVGVDMLVYRHEGGCRIHPAVELNIRMTMGLASQLFYRHFCAPDARGRWRLRYNPAESGLWKEHVELTEKYPMVLSDGRLVSGYLSLTPVTERTRYAVQVLLG